jgi:hypothetical protein
VKRRLCECGRSLYGIGGRCHVCQAQHRAARAEVPEKVVRLPHVDEHRHPAHLSWIRSLPCAVRGCPRRSEAAHVRLNTGGGMGLKPDDCWTIPLCGPNGHHAEQHRIGHGAFDALYLIDSRKLAETLAAESPYLEKEQAIE